MTPREQRIMDSWAGGSSVRAISRDLMLTEKYVRGTVRAYDFVQLGRDMSREERRTREADRRYVAALLATGKSFA